MKTTITPSQLTESLRYCDQADLVPFVLSPPGVGKTDISRQYANSRKKETGQYKPIYLGQHAPTDMCGFPYIDRENNRMRFSVPDMLPDQPDSTIVLDEFTNAPKQSQNLALQIALEKRVGEWVAPKNTFVIVSGNGSGDRCHVEKLSSAMANRVMFLNLVPDLEDWTAWALDHDVDVKVIAFLRFRPDLLSSFDSAKWDGESGFATPRSWSATDRLVKANPSSTLRHTMLEGLLGAGPAAEFNAFLQVYEKLPSIDGILLDPKGADVPEEPSTRYAVCAALAHKATKDNFGRCAEYLGRLPKEFEVFGVRLTYQTKKTEISNCRDFISWAADNSESLL
jgi:hypothetical protein